MERKQKLVKFIIFLIVSVIIGELLWYTGYRHGITEAKNEDQIVESEKVLDNQTIWDVVNSQANYDKYILVGSFHEGLAYASKESERTPLGIFGYIDEDGNEAIDFKYTVAQDFRDGLAAVSEGGGKYGYIDHQGNWVIEPILDGAGNFRDGKAEVQVGIKWYIIDKEGNILEEVKSN